MGDDTAVLRVRRPAARIVAVLLVVAVVGLVQLGRERSYVALGSDSMQPWASPGALLVHRHVPATELGVGDVVTVPIGGGRLVTHRIVRMTDPAAGSVTVRLQGDASRLPDPVPLDLSGEVARVERVVPRLGSLLATRGPLLWGGLALLALGVAALRAQRRHVPELAPVPRTGGSELDETGDVQVLAATTASPDIGLDPRIGALLATCEQLHEDGLPTAVLADLVRVRTCETLGLPSAEGSGAVLSLDDGARFYVMALADADPDALAVVPVASARRHAGSEAIDRWWAAVASAVPTEVHRAIGVLTNGHAEG